MENNQPTNDLAEQLKLIDERIAHLKNNIKIGELIQELDKDERFKTVINEGYLDAEAKRLFEVLTEPSTLKRDVMENVMDKLSSIRNFKQYLVVQLQNANMAPEQIEEEEKYRTEVTAYFANLGSDEE